MHACTVWNDILFVLAGADEHIGLGYNSMGYEMSKPNLRAELEADLKLVSEGRKDKWSVLQHHIQKYKTVFIESVQKAKKWVIF